MKYRTNRQRLDTLQTRIKSAQAAARELSKYDDMYTFIEVGMLRDLVYQLDEVQEHMHSVFVEQSADDMLRVQMQDRIDNDQMQEAADNDA
jgi:hypothetical protein